jgi:hypothetical protein
LAVYLLKNIHFLEGHLRNIPTNNSITHAEEDCSNLSQSECIIDPRSIVEFLIETKIKCPSLIYAYSLFLSFKQKVSNSSLCHKTVRGVVNRNY